MLNVECPKSHTPLYSCRVGYPNILSSFLIKFPEPGKLEGKSKFIKYNLFEISKIQRGLRCIRDKNEKP